MCDSCTCDLVGFNSLWRRHWPAHSSLYHYNAKFGSQLRQQWHLFAANTTSGNEMHCTRHTSIWLNWPDDLSYSYMKLLSMRCSFSDFYFTPFVTVRFRNSPERLVFNLTFYTVFLLCGRLHRFCSKLKL